MSETVIGTFSIERIPAKYGGYRTVCKDDQGKQVGSTFDDDLGDQLAGYPEGAIIALELDKSGDFWDVIGAELSDAGAAKAAPARNPSPSKSVPFSDSDLSFFAGNSARIIAAYLGASKEYVDQVENTENPIETLHKDVVFGAKLLINEFNRKG